MTASIPATAAAIALLLAATLLPQAVLTIWFALAVGRRTREFQARAGVRGRAAAVPAEVVLCLRGCDPTLEAALAALARQSHRAWRLRVIVDSGDDPAWCLAEEALARLVADGAAAWAEHVMEPLAERPVSGSLKCASLRQALRSLAPETRVVALIDADSVVHADWLLTLVDECLRPGVGAVSGNRWYDPDPASPPAVVRAVWNAGAIVQMAAFGIPWGGSLAVRREAAEACGWVEIIERTLCEDTALAGPLARAGWDYRFIPALTAIDRDAEIGFGPLTRWIARQLLTARLHHPLWPLVAAHGIITSAVLTASLAVGLAAWLTGRPAVAAAVALALVIYEVANAVLAALIAGSIRGATFAAGGRRRRWSPAGGLWWVVLIPLTQVVYAVALTRALVARSVEWRGVVYEIRGPNDGGGVTIRQPAASAVAAEVVSG